MAEPMYRQIADDLRRQIESGELHGGEQLPVEVDLRERYRASRNAVRDAIKWLTSAGLVETRPGQGTFVIEKIDPVVIAIGSGLDAEGGNYRSRILSQGKQLELSQPRIEIQVQRPSPVIARELRLTAEQPAEVVSRHRQMFAGGRPWALLTSFYPMSLVRMGADQLVRPGEFPFEGVDYLDRQLAIRQANWSERLLVRAATGSEAEFFAIRSGIPAAVMEVMQTSYDQSGSPYRVAIAVYLADRTRLVMTSGVVPQQSR